MLRFFMLITLALTTLHAEIAPATTIIDQRNIAENSCGPVALMNAYLWSAPAWKATTAKLPKDPAKQFEYLRQRHFRQYSPHTYLKQRWDKKNGARADDMRDAINAFHRKAKLPKVQLEHLFTQKDESHAELANRLHRRIQQSLQNGFPPLLTINRFARIQYQYGGHRWGTLASHYLTVTEASINPENATLTLTYLDPWGGRKLSGTLIPDTERQYFANNVHSKTDKKFRKNPCLSVDFPYSATGAEELTAQQANALVATQLIFATAAPPSIHNTTLSD
ncbi:hypothetical protein [Rubritalea tangerina]|uniref:Peptidase C39-like domain-containing protein n=1 Tax=Rubritalea tangerina TaxID=430798 RepID=A0ABW4Z837_9BACT